MLTPGVPHTLSGLRTIKHRRALEPDNSWGDDARVQAVHLRVGLFDNRIGMRRRAAHATNSMSPSRKRGPIRSAVMWRRADRLANALGYGSLCVGNVPWW